MCCRMMVYPVNLIIAQNILEMGMFKQELDFQGRDQGVWIRRINEEQTNVTAIIGKDALELNIGPAISLYSQHASKRMAAGVYFEIAAKYAEKVGGEIRQLATVMGCRPENANGNNEIVIASYPSHHLNFNKICPGFQEVFLGGNEL